MSLEEVRHPLRSRLSLRVYPLINKLLRPRGDSLRDLRREWILVL